MVKRGGNQRIPRPPGCQPGRPAPWAALPATARRFTLAEVRERLALLPPPRALDRPVPGSRDAAVLVALFEAGEARVVLERRPDTMASHRGEVAFPGGKLEPHDASLRDAALREAHEELGIEPGAVEVVAQLDVIATVASRFAITPFVGLLAERPIVRADPREVSAVLDVPISELLDPAVFREERWRVGGELRAVSFFELTGETVWGATARILTGLLTHLTAPRLAGTPTAAGQPGARGHPG